MGEGTTSYALPRVQTIYTNELAQAHGDGARPRSAYVGMLPEDAVVLFVVEGRARIGVQDCHLGHGQVVEDRVVIIHDVVQHRALMRREADAEAPLLPLHQVAIADFERRTVGLRHIQRLEVGLPAGVGLPIRGRSRPASTWRRAPWDFMTGEAGTASLRSRLLHISRHR